jgi:FkbH-like protein
MKELKYFEILQLNKDLGDKLVLNPYHIAVLSNIIVQPIKEIIEYILRIESINAIVEIGDYDNIVQDSLKHKDSKLVIIFWELCNLTDGFQYKVELLNDYQLDAFIEKTKLEIDLMLRNLHETSLVLFNKFTSFPFSNATIKETKLEKLTCQLNKYLIDNIPGNIRIVDLEKVISNIGKERCYDLRYYYSSKALYSINFYKAYVEFIKPFVMSANGKVKKALIFDCDNTLWKGVLGEDGYENIEMSHKTKDGAIFAEIQSIAITLSNQGVIIGLCSKNNLKDVDDVLRIHPDIQLKEEYITINKSNWSDKVTNLKEIARELNIGLDSLVYIDDSSFEVNLIREQLPQVTVLQVPERLFDYPKLMRENMALFYNLSYTSEDKNKLEMYKQQAIRENNKNNFTGIEDYLISLQLQISIYFNDLSIVPRLSQMSQKTNQFNLTTKRYTEGDIKNLIVSGNSYVFGFFVADKFGEYGITGLCICTKDDSNKSCEIDTFLMSCRIIGRNIEYAFMDYLIDFLNASNIKTVTAKYIRTLKNEQVNDFYDNLQFRLTASNDFIKSYYLDIKNYKPKEMNYINVKDGK